MIKSFVSRASSLALLSGALLMFAAQSAGASGPGEKVPMGTAKSVQSGIVEVDLGKPPANLSAMRSHPAAALSSPYDTVALYVAALLAYPANPDEAMSMIDVLKGPGGPLTKRDKNFLKDRMSNKADYLGNSYIVGTSPENDYRPPVNKVVRIVDKEGRADSHGALRVLVANTGADSPRAVTLRLKPPEGKWYLFNWEGLLMDVRKPRSADPWA